MIADGNELLSLSSEATHENNMGNLEFLSPTRAVKGSRWADLVFCTIAVPGWLSTPHDLLSVLYKKSRVDTTPAVIAEAVSEQSTASSVPFA